MAERADAESASRIPAPIRLYGPAIGVLLAGLLASIVIFLSLRHAAMVDARRQFVGISNERRDLLQKEIDAQLEVLAGVRALFDSSERVSASEFLKYAKPFIERNSNMFALEWIPRVPHERRAEFEAAASKALQTEFRIRERDAGVLRDAQRRDEYRPVYYSQARVANNWIGVDTFYSPDNARAMQTAVQSEAAAAVRVHIEQPGVPQLDLMLVFLPVFDKATNELEGFVRTAFELDTMLAKIAQASSTMGIAVESEVADSADAPAQSDLSWQSSVRIADKHVGLRFVATSDYPNFPRVLPQYALLAISMIVTFLGGAASLQLTKRRLKLQALAQELLAEVNEHRLSEQRYRVLVENSPDAILLQLNGRITFANSSCARLFKVKSSDELIGKSVYDLTSSASHELMRARARILIDEGKIPPPVEETILAADGSKIPVEVLSVPFKTEAGTMIQVIARDITQRKVDETERKRLETALRQSQRIEALGTLAGGIAHDFNNILTAIIGNTRLLLSEMSQSVEVQKTSNEILKAAHRARDLVKRIAAFSQRQESHRTEVAIVPLADEVQQLLRATLPAAIEITVRAPEKTPWAAGNATQIHQVLLNICTNAWQAINGSGSVQIEVTEVIGAEAVPAVMPPLQPAKRYVCIEVRDNGVGIPANVMEHIFEPFFTTKSTGQGSGLGLAVVHGIVQSHRGGIAVHSETGKGTSFFVYLPACDAPTDKSADQTDIQAAGGKQHVLYVDDEEPLVFLVGRLLERDGYRYSGTHDARTALNMVRETPQSFDLLVSDLNMPTMSGLDLAREALALRPDLPVIITTGYVRSDDVEAAKQIGVRAVVLKPDTIEAMGALVLSHLQ